MTTTYAKKHCARVWARKRVVIALWNARIAFICNAGSRRPNKIVIPVLVKKRIKKSRHYIEGKISEKSFAKGIDKGV